MRWVKNKEEHANFIQEEVQRYFMTQRIKLAEPSDEEAHAKYINELTLLHEMLIHAMKAKQTTDLAHVQALHDKLKLFQESYFQKAATS